MYELNTVAIVRYCRAKNAAPKLGFLLPHIKQDYEVNTFDLIAVLNLYVQDHIRSITYAVYIEAKKKKKN